MRRILDRRSVLGATALALSPRGPTQLEDGGSAHILIEKGVRWLGGQAVLEARPVLSWAGRAVVHGEAGPIEIGLETVVEPFRYARTESWRLSEGRALGRALVLDGGEGWMMQGGQRSAMGPAMREHERQQYAIYGLMRLVGLRPDQARWLEPDGEGREGLEVRHGLAPVTRFRFDADGRIASAENSVVGAEAGAEPTPQAFVFEGEIEGGGVRWFRAMRLARAGQPYFDLKLDRFEALAARP